MWEQTQWFIGALMVIVYAHARFNKPASNRISTTAQRYWVAAGCYYVTLMLAFALLSGAISSSPVLLDFLLAGGSVNLGEARNLPGPLIAALLLTALLPNLPLVDRLDRLLRRSFQHIGNIPNGAQQLATLLRQADYEAPDDVRGALADEIDELPVRRLGNNDLLLVSRWSRLVSLRLQVLSWVDEPHYERFAHSAREQFLDVEQGYQKIRKKAATYLALAASVEGANGDVKRALRALRRDLGDELDALHQQLCGYVAQGVLCSEVAAGPRKRRLEDMGFCGVDEQSGVLDVNQVVALWMLVVVAMIVGVLVLNGQQQDSGRGLLIAAMVATIYSAAVVSAIVPKSNWRHASVAQIGRRPWFAYWVSGALAVLLGMTVSVAFNYGWYGDFVAAVWEIQLTYPWYLLTFVTAVSLAFLADDFHAREVDPAWARWMEGLLLAGLLALCAVLVRDLLAGIPNKPLEDVPPLHAVVCVSAAIGMGLGSFVPSWYRDSRRPGQHSSGTLTRSATKELAHVVT